MNITLRKLTPGHFELNVRWRNASKQWFTPQDDWTVEGQREWYENVYTRDPASHVFIIMADDAPAGVLAYRSGTGEVGPVLLGEERLRRQGIMTAALRQLYAAFGAGRYWLRVVEGNTAAIALYEKDGYRAVPPQWLPPAARVAVTVPQGQVLMGREVSEGDLA